EKVNHRDRRQQRRGRDRSAPSGLRSHNDYVELRPPGRAIRRGSPRWTTTFDQAIETTLDWVSDFLSLTAVLIVWLDPLQPAAGRPLGQPRLSDRGRHRA